MRSKIKLVSFDVWDTLLSINKFYTSISEKLSNLVSANQVDLERKLLEGYNELKTMRRLGRFDDSKIVQMALQAMSEILEIDPETIEKATVQAAIGSGSEQYVVDGAIEALETARSSGAEVVVIGNVVFWSGNYNRMILEKAGLSKFFANQFYADEVGVSKPKPAIFSKALSEFNVKPHEAIHVGNSLLEDFVGAVLSGMGAVLIDRKMSSVTKLSDWNAYFVPDMKRLTDLLSSELLL